MRSPTLFVLAALTSACSSVASIESAISVANRDTTPFEPRLLGTWEYGEEDDVEWRMVVTRGKPAGYVLEVIVVDEDTTLFFHGITGIQ